MAAQITLPAPPSNNDSRIFSSCVASASQQPRFLLSKPYDVKRMASRGFVSLNPRCEIASADLVKDYSTASSRQLKTSAANRYTKEKSSVVVLGFDVHNSADEMLEKLSIAEEQCPQAIGELCALNHIEEAAVISTCNRVEIYVVALSQRRGVKEVTDWMSKRSGVPLSDLCQLRFLLYEKDAITHLLQVFAAPESSDQVKQIIKAGESVPGFGKKLSGLFEHAIMVEKRVRSETSIGADLEKAEHIITDELKECQGWIDTPETTSTIKKLMAYAERIRASELEKCFSKMGGDDDISTEEKEAVCDFSKSITSKLLHGPMAHLSCDGSHVLENMHTINRIFGLENETSGFEQKIQSKIEKQKA